MFRCSHYTPDFSNHPDISSNPTPNFLPWSGLNLIKHGDTGTSPGQAAKWRSVAGLCSGKTIVAMKQRHIRIVCVCLCVYVITFIYKSNFRIKPSTFKKSFKTSGLTYRYYNNNIDLKL